MIFCIISLFSIQIFDICSWELGTFRYGSPGRKITSGETDLWEKERINSASLWNESESSSEGKATMLITEDPHISVRSLIPFTLLISGPCVALHRVTMFLLHCHH